MEVSPDQHQSGHELAQLSERPRSIVLTETGTGNRLIITPTCSNFALDAREYVATRFNAFDKSPVQPQRPPGPLNLRPLSRTRRSIIIILVFIIFFCIFFSFLLVFPFKESTRNVLRLSFDSEGEFKILQITDTHLGGSAEMDASTVEAIGDMLDRESPNLVLFTGDIISGYCYIEDSDMEGFTVEQYAKAVSPLIEREIPWMFILGNHDTEGDMTRAELMDLDKLQRLSVSGDNPDSISGVSNYFVRIHARDTNPTAKPLDILALDSNDYHCLGVHSWGCVMPDQVEWVASELQQRLLSDEIAANLFVALHIPLPEMHKAWHTTVVNGTGWREEVNCPYINTGLFDLLRHDDRMLGMVFGHDHRNDYSTVFKNIKMFYGRKSGFGSYSGKIPVGARVFIFNDKSPQDYHHYVIDYDQKMPHAQYPHYPTLSYEQLDCDSLFIVPPEDEQPEPAVGNAGSLVSYCEASDKSL